MPKLPAVRDPGEWYPVMLCVGCRHPGGQHILDGGCRLCSGCTGWGEQQGAHGYWNDRMTRDLLAAIGNPEPAETITENFLRGLLPAEQKEAAT